MGVKHAFWLTEGGRLRILIADTENLIPVDFAILLSRSFRIRDEFALQRKVFNFARPGESKTFFWARRRSPAFYLADMPFHDPVSYAIQPKALSEVLADIKLKLGARGGMRVVGDPHMKVQRLALLPGLRPLSDVLKCLPQSDLVIIGETRDWEGPEYSSDANAAGFKKGYAQIGRVVSEDPGMLSFSKWIQSFVKKVPVQAIAAGDPYWRPA